MRIVDLSRGYVSILVFMLIIGCEKEPSAPAEPPRPQNVPSASVWVGGLDGGVFVLVRKTEKAGKDMYSGEIYYVSGDLAYKGLMKRFPSGAADFDPTKKESFEGWDGDTLYLRNDQHLKTQEKSKTRP